MVKLEEINTTSTFAWSQTGGLPLLATATVAGALNANFDLSSSLEIFDIFNKKTSLFKQDASSRFYSIAWSKPWSCYTSGVIVGAYEDGSLEFYNVLKLLSKNGNLKSSLIYKSIKHTSHVKSLQFNPINSNILVSGGSNGQIFIWNLDTLDSPTIPGQSMSPIDEISSVSWNNSVSHIFASSSKNYTSVWDLKTKREVLHLQYTSPTNGTKASFSHVAWHPTQSTKLITASDNDSCPVILTWDLRNSNEPEKVLQGHEKGVLSLDWCKHDPNLLISSGKDNNVLLWNPITGEKLGHYPITSNWTFQTKFAPSTPDYFATASFDGKIIIQSLQDTSPPSSTKITSNDDNTFWNQLSTTETNQPVFDIKQAPLWLKRPANVSFGFGSKLVTIVTNDGKSEVKISKVNIGSKTSVSTEFINALNSNDFNTIIESNLTNSISDTDKSDWEALKKILNKEKLFESIDVEAVESTSNGSNNLIESSESFFDNLESKLDSAPDYTPKGDFKLFSDDDTDKELIKLILVKKIDKAVEILIKEGKLEEAFVLALDGSKEIKQKVKNSYFNKNSGSTLSRVLYSATSNDVTDIVVNAEVDSWKEIASSISSFTTDENEYRQKITELGDRISASGDKKDARDNSVSCYLAGNALDKIASIWLKELSDYESKLLKSESSNVSTPTEARLETLTNLAQKIAAYRSITKESGSLSGPAAEQIAKPILEYCNLLAGNGEFDLAEKFLHLLPSGFGGVEKDRILKASSKGSLATTAAAKSKAAATTSARGPSAKASSTSIKPVGQGYAIPPTRSTGSTYALPTNTFKPSPAPVNSFNPLSSNPPANNYSAPSSSQPPLPQQSIAPPIPVNPYARSNPYAPQASHNNIYKSNAPTPGVISPPPPSGPSKPSFKKETEGWNDLPDTFKTAAPPRRAAPSQTLSTTPLPSTPLSNSTSNFPSLGNNPVPPPKGISRKGSSTSISQQVRSPKLAAPQINNRYAPPPSATPQPQPTLSSTPSFGAPTSTKNPYAPPPTDASAPRVSYAPPPVAQIPSSIGSPSLKQQSSSTPPPKNPYAPSPQTQQQPNNGAHNPYGPPAQSLGAPPPAFGKQSNSGVYPPPPPGPTAPPTNQYAAPPPSNQYAAPPPSNQYAAPPPSNQYAAPPPSNQYAAPPPSNQYAAPPPSNQYGAPPPQRVASIQDQPIVEPTKPKYPSGDRAHIHEDALPIYQTLSRVQEALKPVIPEKYEKHSQDMLKRLNYLFDHLNNDDLLSPGTIEELKAVASALEARDFSNASALNIALATNHPEEVGNWHVGVKRLITMAEALY